MAGDADAVEQEPSEWIIASGSLARGMPEDFYARIARIAARSGRRFALDTSGSPLRMALGNGMAIIKPSLGEFEALIGHKLGAAKNWSRPRCRWCMPAPPSASP